MLKGKEQQPAAKLKRDSQFQSHLRRTYKNGLFHIRSCLKQIHHTTQGSAEIMERCVPGFNNRPNKLSFQHTVLLKTLRHTTQMSLDNEQRRYKLAPSS